ncbi:MAG: BamA/TamA family outer membrane protein [Bacteroidetes bacterium]|nr:BamA/TamA family outer membrane protein [Bacteroidota bacterium]
MNRTKIRIIIATLLFVVSSCRINRYVPNGMYLLKSNEIVMNKNTISKEEVMSIVRQKPNQKTFGLPIKLFIFNSIDSVKIADKRLKKKKSFDFKLKKKREKVNKINQKRIRKAIKRGETEYDEKVLSDTVFSKVLFREKLKYKFGQKPIVFDSILFDKSVEQIALFLKKKGYYYNNVKGNVNYSEKDSKAAVSYSINSGPLYVIDSVKLLGSSLIIALYKKYERKQLANEGEYPFRNIPFDLDYLELFREDFSKFTRDETVYKFYTSNIHFTADTLKKTMKVNLILEFLDRFVQDPNNKDSVKKVPFYSTEIKNVYFHLSDTLNVKGSYSNLMLSKGIELTDSLAPQFLNTLNTVFYQKISYSKKKREKLKLPKGTPDPFRMVYVKYNGDKPWIKPEILELQNYLEQNNKFKEYYLDRSYRSLIQLGVFSSIKPILVEIPGTNKLDVHYYLEPAEKQSFGFEPKFTTTSGLMGANASVNYTNKNLFRGTEKVTLSFGGGFETQTQVLDASRKGNFFNTFEIGPSVKLDLPGLFPTPPTLLKSKRQKPRTEITTALNFEKRDIFDRRVFQLNYMWKFLVGKTQVFKMGFPGASVIKFVQIDPSPQFEQQLNTINDAFLTSSYSDQFVWQDFKFSWEFNNKEKDFQEGKKRFLNSIIYFSTTLDAAGNLLYAFRGRQDMISDQYQFQNLIYSQFVRIDNQYILTKKLKQKTSLHMRLSGGGGIPYRNTKTTLPYDYSFFAGGSNDNRGWTARALGPGGYKYHLDTNRLGTQIADIRLGGSVEYRFSMGSMFKGAVFSDFGNIWTYNEDQSRQYSKFELKSFLPQIALSAGVGLRLDLDFFVIRLDIGFPIYNPAYEDGARWVFQDMKTRATYYKEGELFFGQTNEQVRKIMPKPFPINFFNFGIGYPF